MAKCPTSDNLIRFPNGTCKKYHLMKNVLFLLNLLIPFAVNAQIDPIDASGLAIGGYDVVEYFRSNKAVKGTAAFSARWNNAIYYFTSEANKKTFENEPSRYLPQYDGYCALAIGTTGKKISIDPNTFKVTDGKLYLFFHGKTFSGTTFNSLEPWEKDEAELIRKSDKNWPAVRIKKYHRLR